MVFYLNRGLSIEQELIKIIKEYFNNINISEYLNNSSLNISNEKILTQICLDNNIEVKNILPAISITSEGDSKPIELYDLVQHCEGFTLYNSDIPKLHQSAYMLTQSTINQITESIKDRDCLYGITNGIRRLENICIEIWCENKKYKNDIYELLWLFISGNMKNILDKSYNNNVVIFDDSLEGKRNYNINDKIIDVNIYGAQILFECEYFIEQSLLNTELTEINKNIFTEVKSHVKNQ